MRESIVLCLFVHLGSKECNLLFFWEIYLCSDRAGPNGSAAMNNAAGGPLLNWMRQLNSGLPDYRPSWSRAHHLRALYLDPLKTTYEDVEPYAAEALEHRADRARVLFILAPLRAYCAEKGGDCGQGKTPATSVD